MSVSNVGATTLFAVWLSFITIVIIATGVTLYVCKSKWNPSTIISNIQESPTVIQSGEEDGKKRMGARRREVLTQHRTHQYTSVSEELLNYCSDQSNNQQQDKRCCKNTVQSVECITAQQQFSSSSPYYSFQIKPSEKEEKDKAKAKSTTTATATATPSTSSLDKEIQKLRETEVLRKGYERDRALERPVCVETPMAMRFGKSDIAARAKHQNSPEFMSYSNSEITRNYLSPPPNRSVADIKDSHSRNVYDTSSSQSSSSRKRAV